MRILIQRCTESVLKINNQIFSSINNGMVVFLGIENEDAEEDINWLIGKILKLRIFDDKNGIMNLSIQDIDGEVMIVSQFTLHASTQKGNRPSYIKAASSEIAKPLYEQFVKIMQEKSSKEIATGEFGADMKISLTNDGPVTIFIDSKNKE